MTLRKVFFLTLTFICFAKQINAQGFTVNGNARNLSNTNCYQITEAKNWQNGSVWFTQKLDLRKSFDLEFYLNFGNSDDGADGIVFVLQTVGPNALGNGGGSIGFEGFSPAFGIEFDDYQNISANDPAYDHIALVKNGSVNHPTSIGPYFPVSALSNRGNIEDGKDHLVRIKWDPNGFQLELYFDCDLRLKLKDIDIVKTIFNNQPIVWWGFTSATGGANNTHTVCIQNNDFRKKSYDICENGSLLLNTGQSIDNKYTWIPNTYLSDASIKTPICTPTKSMKYLVTYKDRCNNGVTDTVDVNIIKKPIVVLPRDTFFCKGTGIFINPTIKNDFDRYTWSNAYPNLGQSISSKNTYWLEAINDCGADRDTININEYLLPTLDLGRDTIFCVGQNIDVKPKFTGDLSSFEWMDKSPLLNRSINTSTILWASIQNVCGTVSDTIVLSLLNDLSLNLGKDTIICPGQLVNIQPKFTGNYNTFLWHDGYNSLNRQVSSKQKLSLSISNSCSKATDTISIDIFPLIPIDLGRDTTICAGDTLFLNIDDKVYSNILWENNSTGNSRQLSLSGKYSVQAKYGLCSTSDTITISIDNSPYVSTFKDTLACFNVPLIYNLDTRNQSVIWSDGDQKFEKTFLNKEGDFWVEAFAKCGNFKTGFNISLEVCNCDVWVPNAFSPHNEDQLNDNFGIKYQCDFTGFHLAIYNRWGEKLWETNDPNDEWDGTSQGSPLPLGLYVWTASYVGPENGIPKNYAKRGVITLIR